MGDGLFICLDNIIFQLQGAAGISLYWHELIKRFIRSNETVFFVERHSNTFRNIFRQSLQLRKGNVLRENKIPLFFQRYVNPSLNLPPKSIFHSSYYRTLRQANVLNFITVYDFTYEYYRSGIVRRVHSFQKARAIKRADGIICISENTKKDLKKFYPDIDSERIRVIYLGISDDFFPLKEKKNDLLDARDDKKVILYLGSRMKYKNFDLAVEVVSSLTEYKLTIVGGGALTKSEVALLRKKLGTRFHYVSSLSPVQLNGLYNIAFCLLYPSMYEGFGLPIGEAMKAGCPVVTTRFSSIPEVCGNACVVLDGSSPDGFAAAIKQLEDERYRKLLVDKGIEQATKFSWDHCFQETLAFYGEVFRHKFG